MTPASNMSEAWAFTPAAYPSGENGPHHIRETPTPIAERLRVLAVATLDRDWRRAEAFDVYTTTVAGL